MKTDTHYLKMIRPDGVYYFISVGSALKLSGIISDNSDGNLYEWKDTPRGWMYVPIP